MSKFARIIGNVAIDVCVDPETRFHPDIAKEFVSVPDEVESGYIFYEGVWTKPQVVEEAIPQVTISASVTVSTFDFKLLFTPTERVAIAEAKATDALINDFFTLIDDPRMTTVDMGRQSTKDIINHLVSVNIITQDRSVDILAAKPV